MRKSYVALILSAAIAAAPVVRAQDHLVSRQDTASQLKEAAAERAHHLATLDATLALPQAHQAAAVAGFDVGKLRAGLPQLSDTDLRELSARAAALRADPAAGHYRYHDAVEGLLFIALLAAIALVIIDVSAR
jgi:hypothetical protein